MLDAIDTASYRSGMDYGAMGAAFGKDRDEKAVRRAEAARGGQLASGTEDIEKKVRTVAEEFVSVFMNQVMKSMRATVPENAAMHGDNGEKFFQEMLDSEQSKSLARGHGYGLTDLIHESMMTQYRTRQAPSIAAAANAANGASGFAAQNDAAESDMAEDAGEQELAVGAIG